MMLKKKFLLLCICAFATALSVGAAEHVTEIEVLKGEKWWGLDYGGRMSNDKRLKQPLEGPIQEPNWAMDAPMPDPYKPILVSNAGRYIYSEKPIKVEFDNEKFTITSEHEKVEVQSGGKSLREAYVVCALKNFTPGQSPDPQMFALPVYETKFEFENTLSEDEIVKYAEKLLAEGFPAGIIVVADGWQKVNGPYEFDPELYPDPKRMVDRLHALGFKVMLTVTPNVPKWGSVYGAAERDSQIVSCGVWASSPVALDMSNDTQFTRLRTGFDKIKAVCGFDGFRFDGNYRMPIGSKFLENMLSLGEGLEMVQYNRVMDKPYPPYMSSMWISKIGESVVKDIITAGLVGYSYVQTEFSPYFIIWQEWTDKDKEMFRDDYEEDYKDHQRKMADYLLLQCGMPMMSVDFAPWRITDPKLYKGVKDAINFRASLADYMIKLVEDSRRTGEPLVRHMEYQYPKSAFFDCNDQFMLGPKYLFAPCVDGADKRMVRLPKGTWVDRNGSKIRGPVVKEVDCSAGELIYFEAAR